LLFCCCSAANCCRCCCCCCCCCCRPSSLALLTSLCCGARIPEQNQHSVPTHLGRRSRQPLPIAATSLPARQIPLSLRPLRASEHPKNSHFSPPQYGRSQEKEFRINHIRCQQTPQGHSRRRRHWRSPASRTSPASSSCATRIPNSRAPNNTVSPSCWVEPIPINQHVLSFLASVHPVPPVSYHLPDIGWSFCHAVNGADSDPDSHYGQRQLHAGKRTPWRTRCICLRPCECPPAPIVAS
jgi:hypothetical protein